MIWKKKKIHEEKQNVSVETQEDDISTVSKVVFTTLVILFVLSPVISKIMYADLPHSKSSGAENMEYMCFESELLYEGKTYNLSTSYEMFPIRFATHGSRKGCIILYGPSVFERAKEEGIYAKCWDKSGNESVEVASVDGKIYLHLSNGMYYRSRIPKGHSTFFFEGVEHIRDDTLDEWIAEILRVYG